MASGHVPSEQHPHPGQPMYTDASNMDQLFPRANQYQNAAASWGQFGQNSHGAAFPQQNSNTNSHAWQVRNPQSYNPGGQSYGNTTQAYQPQSSYHFSPYSSHGPQNNYGHQAVVDPALQDSSAVRTQQQSPYQAALRASGPQGQPTVSPQVLQQNGVPLQNIRASGPQYQIPKTTSELFTQRATPQFAVPQPVSKPNFVLPKGKWMGGLSVIDQTALGKATRSVPLNKFVNIGTELIYIATNRTALPVYTPRQSVKDMKKSGAGNKKLLDRQAQKQKSSANRMLVAKAAASRIGAGSPSVLLSDSDSEDYTDSSEESEYTDSEDEEVSPLPSSRSDDPLEAVRYDVIKSSWLPRKDQPTQDKIKHCMSELWEVLSTIQKRWRADSKAVEEAKEAKKVGELPVLKKRVADQRELLQFALKTALECSHPNVLWNLGKAKQFLYLIYQFLANRFKEQDYDGKLSTVIYQVLARIAGALTIEVMEETKLSRALNLMKKNANDKNKAVIQQIIDGAAANSKKAKVSSPPKDNAADAKNGKRPASANSTSNTGASRPAAEGPAVKKLKASEPASPLLKQASAAAAGSRAGPTPATAPQKRPGEKPTTAPVKARVTPINKSSGFFSTLNAASKKPAPAAAPTNGTKGSQPKVAGVTAVKEKKPETTPAKPSFSFADTMALLTQPKKEVVAAPKPEKKLPPETPEEKAKRLRKESRRHLRVAFRPDASLVDIRYFSHDPDEEQGHDENFVRDAGDIGGEGRMFKQHRDMMDDEDEDEEADASQREWTEPKPIDFSMMPPDAVQNYAPYGGGTKIPTSPEKEANERREASVLMVHYTSASDIPPTPREPPDEPEERTVPPKEFGMPEPTNPVIQRAPKAPVDLGLLESIVSQLKNQPPPAQAPVSQGIYVPPPPAVAPTTPAAPDPSANLSAIFSAFTQQAPQQAPAIPPLAMSQHAPGLDVNALIMQLGIAQGAAPNVGAFPAGPPPPFPPQYAQLAQAFQQQQQQQQQFGQMDSNFQHQQPPQHNQNSGTGTKRQRDDGAHNNERGHGSFKKSKNGKNWYGDRPHKVLPCKFYQQGKCNKGEDCTYIHDRS